MICIFFLALEYCVIILSLLDKKYFERVEKCCDRHIARMTYKSFLFTTSNRLKPIHIWAGFINYFNANSNLKVNFKLITDFIITYCQ